MQGARRSFENSSGAEPDASGKAFEGAGDALQSARADFEATGSANGGNDEFKRENRRNETTEAIYCKRVVSRPAIDERDD